MQGEEGKGNKKKKHRANSHRACFPKANTQQKDLAGVLYSPY
jgi:hypothetical protein